MPYPQLLRLCAFTLAVGAALNTPSAFANMPVKPDITPKVPSSQPDTDQLIVRFRDTTSTAAADKVLGKMRTEKKQSFRYTKSTFQKSDVFRFDKRKGKAEWDTLSTWLKAQPEVEYAEPDYILTKMVTPTVPPAYTPNDPYLSYQWPLLDAISGIRADQAWGYTTGNGSVVAVIDTGILPHADLKPNLLPGYDMINDKLVANDGNGRDADSTDPGDYVLAGECGSASAISSSWHGTHVAGTIAAVGNNAAGVAGVAFGAKVMPLRALGKCGGYTSDIADAITWAVGGAVTGAPVNPTPARVINMSLGGTSTCGITMQNAINTARSKKAVVVVAAGNSNTDASTSSPANCPGVITVAATGRNGGKAYYSNYGSIVDIAAPGGSMNTGSADGILSTLNTGKQQAVADTYAHYQGTSMATPHIAGVAALMLAANPALTPDQVESLLKSSARTFPAPCTGCGTGLVDANAAVQAALSTPPPAVDPYAAIRTALTANSTLWTNKKIRNYSYILEQATGTATPLRLKLVIRSGILYSGVNLSTGKSLSYTDLKTKGKTIEQLFSTVNSAINAKAASIKVSYDLTLGYPTSISVDPSSSVVGDENTLKASRFIRL